MLDRLIQADPVLGDELQDDRGDEGLGDAADPDLVTGLRRGAGDEVGQPDAPAQRPAEPPTVTSAAVS